MVRFYGPACGSDSVTTRLGWFFGAGRERSTLPGPFGHRDVGSFGGSLWSGPGGMPERRTGLPSSGERMDGALPVVGRRADPRVVTPMAVENYNDSGDRGGDPSGGRGATPDQRLGRLALISRKRTRRKRRKRERLCYLQRQRNLRMHNRKKQSRNVVTFGCWNVRSWGGVGTRGDPLLKTQGGDGKPVCLVIWPFLKMGYVNM